MKKSDNLKKIPNISSVLRALLIADFITQLRNRRAVILSLLAPVIILIAWKSLVTSMGEVVVLASCITIGLNAIGLVAYSSSIARDRDKGVFQRLRIAPIPKWTIICSRLIVQLFMILLIASIVFIFGYFIDGIKISVIGYLLAYFAAILGGALYLSIGQLIVGLISNPETVNSTSRMVYFVFLSVGMLGQTDILGNQFKEISLWSPYGSVQLILTCSMKPSTWNNTATLSFFFTVGYIILFTMLGVKKFKWIAK